MSVCAMVKSPQHEQERSYYVPVCTEELYRDVIFPIAAAHNLSLIDKWNGLAEVNRENRNLFFEQLKILCDYVNQLDNCSVQTKQHILQRIKTLSFEIDRMLDARADIVIWIG